ELVEYLLRITEKITQKMKLSKKFNILLQYAVLVIIAFLRCGLIDVILEITENINSEIRSFGQILLKNLQQFCGDFFPAKLFNQYFSLDAVELDAIDFKSSKYKMASNLIININFSLPFNENFVPLKSVFVPTNEAEQAERNSSAKSKESEKVNSFIENLFEKVKKIDIFSFYRRYRYLIKNIPNNIDFPHFLISHKNFRLGVNERKHVF
ncbi:hypothetical protein MHBO_004495, partial [Bonamia ostreae]